MLSPNVVMDADVVGNIIAAVRAGVGGSVLPKGDLSDMSGDDLGEPEAIEPPVFLTCSIISSDNFPLTKAAEKVRAYLSGSSRPACMKPGHPGSNGLTPGKALYAIRASIVSIAELFSHVSWSRWNGNESSP